MLQSCSSFFVVFIFWLIFHAGSLEDLHVVADFSDVMDLKFFRLLEGSM